MNSRHFFSPPRRRSFTDALISTASLIIPSANSALFRSIRQERCPTSLPTTSELLATRSTQRRVAGVVDPPVLQSRAVYGNRLNYFIELGRTSSFLSRSLRRRTIRALPETPRRPVRSYPTGKARRRSRLPGSEIVDGLLTPSRRR